MPIPSLPQQPDFGELIAAAGTADCRRAGERQCQLVCPTGALVDGIAQIQKTVSRFKQRYFEKAELTTTGGAPLGIDIFNFARRSLLIIGRLDQFKTETGVNKEKYSSFELFRRALRDPES